MKPVFKVGDRFRLKWWEESYPDGVVAQVDSLGNPRQWDGGFEDRDECVLIAGAPAVESAVDHPRHYTSDPSGVECIDIAEHRNFCIGNALKYLWRAGLKGDDTKLIEDLNKAIWYIRREVARLEKA